MTISDEDWDVNQRYSQTQSIGYFSGTAVAARIARIFDRWKKFDAGRQAHARIALERIRDAHGLSKDVGEIVQRALA